MAVLSPWRRVLAVLMTAALLLVAMPASSDAARPDLAGSSMATVGDVSAAAEPGPAEALTPADADDPTPADLTTGPPGCAGENCPHIDLMPAAGGSETAQFFAPARRRPGEDRGASVALAAGLERPPRA